MEMQFGIYLNTKGKEVLRVNSPYWIPKGDEWVYLTPDVNMTLVKIRELARERGLVDKPSEIAWGDFPRDVR